MSRAMHYAIMIGCTVASLLIAGQSRGEGPRESPESERALVAEYKAALLKLKGSLNHIQCSGVLSEIYHLENNQIQESRRRIEFKRKGDKSRLILQNLGKDGSVTGTEDCYIYNQQFSYILRKPGKSDKYYMKQALATKGNLVNLAFKKYAIGYVEAATTLHGWDIAEMLDSKGFQLKGVRKIKAPDAHLVRFEFEHSFPGENRSAVSGWWTVSPAAGWEVQEFETGNRGNDKNSFRTTHGTVIYDAFTDGARVPKRIDVRYKMKDVSWEFSCAFDLYSLSLPQDRDFELSAFGLGNARIAYGSQSQNRIAFTLIIMAIAAYIVSYVLKLVINSKIRMDIGSGS